MKISADVLPVLSMLDIQGHEVRITEQLDRSLYTKVNKVLEALGGTWNRKAKAHVFDADAGPRLDHAMTTGEVETGQDVGFFETPELLARTLVELAGVMHGDHVLEPSAGRGRIVCAIQNAGGRVTAVEWDRDRRLQLVETVLKGRDTMADVDDFMELRGRARFNCVVMNPPFCKSGIGDHLDHVRHAHSMLVPGGVLVSVLPSSVEFRKDRRYRAFREWVAELDGTIKPLPVGSFKASGTGVNTVVVRVAR